VSVCVCVCMCMCVYECTCLRVLSVIDVNRPMHPYAFNEIYRYV
jgi:hypothetical protein